MRVLIVGNGCRGYEKEVNQFTKFFDYTFTTWRGIDIVPEARRCGIKSDPGANELIKKADEVCVLGSRLHIGQRGYNGEFTNAKVTVVDIDQDELDKLPKKYIRINIDVKTFILRIINNDSLI